MTEVCGTMCCTPAQGNNPLSSILAPLHSQPFWLGQPCSADAHSCASLHVGNLILIAEEGVAALSASLQFVSYVGLMPGYHTGGKKASAAAKANTILLHSLLNSSSVVKLYRQLFPEILDGPCPGILQLLLERSQLQAIQLWRDTHPQPAAPGWNMVVPREKPVDGETSKGCCLWLQSPQGASSVP